MIHFWSADLRSLFRCLVHKGIIFVELIFGGQSSEYDALKVSQPLDKNVHRLPYHPTADVKPPIGLHSPPSISLAKMREDVLSNFKSNRQLQLPRLFSDS